MDVVKLVTVGPVIVDVVNLKAAVRWKVVGLYRAQISTYDLRVGVLLGFLYLC